MTENNDTLIRLNFRVPASTEAHLKNVQKRSESSSLNSAVKVAAMIASNVLDHLNKKGRRVAVIDSKGRIIHEIEYVVK